MNRQLVAFSQFTISSGSSRLREILELFIKFMMRMELPTVGQSITITGIKEFSNVPGIENKGFTILLKSH
jgi:hypothetical protein